MDRYTVKHLLQHDFFLEDSGLKVELVNREDEASNRPDIQMRLRVVDAKKRKDKHKENEAIQFDFNIHSDQAEEVAKELVKRDKGFCQPSNAEKQLEWCCCLLLCLVQKVTIAVKQMTK